MTPAELGARIAIPLLLGALIGFERQWHRRQATSSELEVQYRIEVICRDRDEAHLRTLLLEAVARGPLILRRVRRKEVADSDNVLLEFTFISEGRHHETIEQIARRLGGRPGVTSVTWEAAEERTDY